MVILFAIFSVLLGLAFGSFLNVCISRLPNQESIVKPASRCPACKKPIRAVDNIPLLSWFLLRRQCRFCGWKIPKRYPLVELGTAALFLFDYLVFGLTFEAAGMAMLCLLLLGLAVMDAETMLLPDVLTFPGIASGILYSGLLQGWSAAGWAILYAVIAAALVMIIRGAYWLVRRREGMGMGDAKLLAMIAAWLGPGRAALALFLGVVTAAVFGLILISRMRGKKVQSGGNKAPALAKTAGRRELPASFTKSGTLQTSQKTGRQIQPSRRVAATTTAVVVEAKPLQIPFGSFLCAAGLYAIFFGQQTLTWYMQFLR